MKKTGQAVIEFCFAVSVFMALVFGMIKIVQWTMMDLAERRYDHDYVLTAGANAREQLNPNFHKVRSIDGSIFTTP